MADERVRFLRALSSRRLVGNEGRLTGLVHRRADAGHAGSYRRLADTGRRQPGHPERVDGRPARTRRHPDVGVIRYVGCVSPVPLLIALCEDTPTTTIPTSPSRGGGGTDCGTPGADTHKRQLNFETFSYLKFTYTSRLSNRKPHHRKTCDSESLPVLQSIRPGIPFATTPEKHSSASQTGVP